MPEKPDSVIYEMWKDPGGNNLQRINLIFDSTADRLPRNIQEGTTCGIYALHAATNVRGKHVAPAARKQQADPNWRQKWVDAGAISENRPLSIRSEAINGPDRLSQIGEINGADDMHRLASSLGIATKILTFRDVLQLWTHIVESVDNGHAIVFPYTAAHSGEVSRVKGPDDFTHWALLCGYAISKKGSSFVFMTTYGAYHMDHALHLFESNLRIQDWTAQKWVKITLWTREPKENWKVWKSEWMPHHNRKDVLLSMGHAAKGIGFGFGTKTKHICTLVEPDGIPSYNIPDYLLDNAIQRSVELTAMPYSKTMAGKCVVVT